MSLRFTPRALAEAKRMKMWCVGTGPLLPMRSRRS